MTKNVPGITEAEWRVMRVLWRVQGASGRDDQGWTSSEVVRALAAESGDAAWKPPTVKTLLGRLVEKGAVGYTARGREYVYFPRVREEDAIRAASGNFLDRMFGGALAPMLAHFVQAGTLSEREIAEMRAILDDAERARQTANAARDRRA